MTDQIPDAATMRAFNKAVVDEFRANAGKVGGRPYARGRAYREDHYDE